MLILLDNFLINLAAVSKLQDAKNGVNFVVVLILVSRLSPEHSGDAACVFKAESGFDYAVSQCV